MRIISSVRTRRFHERKTINLMNRFIIYSEVCGIGYVFPRTRHEISIAEEYKNHNDAHIKSTEHTKSRSISKLTNSS
jgi:hypothetical protein